MSPDLVAEVALLEVSRLQRAALLLPNGTAPMNLPEIDYPETPAGKRSVRRNIWGNTVGYVSGRRFWEFGDDEKAAGLWVRGATLEDARDWNDAGLPPVSE